MTLAADLDLPYFILGLDTTAPVLRVIAEHRVSPPDDLPVVIEANEPVGAVHLTFFDAHGDAYALGVIVDETTVTTLLPSVGLATGPGRLHIEVADEVGNLAVLDWPVVIDRPRTYDVAVWTETAYAVGTFRTKAFEVEPAHGSIYGVVLTREAVDGG